MSGIPREVRSEYSTQAEVDAERFAESPIGRMIAAVGLYAAGRKSDVDRGAETPALASLMINSASA